MDWELASANADLVDFTAALTTSARCTRCSGAAGSSRASRSAAARSCGDIAWFTPSGEEMKEQNWDDAFGRSVIVFLNGEGMADLDQRGMRVTDDSFLLAFNAHHEDMAMTLPGNGYGKQWQLVIDTAAGVVTDPGADGAEIFAAGGQVTLKARSLAVLQRVDEDGR